MATLEWIGKAAVLNHHREVPYRLLEEHKALSVGDAAVLRTLSRHEGPRVIYGEGCRLSRSRLKQENITFRQIPYQLAHA